MLAAPLARLLFGVASSAPSARAGAADAVSVTEAIRAHQRAPTEAGAEAAVGMVGHKRLRMDKICEEDEEYPGLAAAVMATTVGTGADLSVVGTSMEVDEAAQWQWNTWADALAPAGGWRCARCRFS